MLVKIFGICGFSYVLLCAVIFLLQRNLLYLPETTRLEPQQVREAGFRPWPSWAHWQGWLDLEEPAERKGTVIVFHGNAGAASDRGFYAQALSKCHLRVILAEYPGYGGRAGIPGEEVLVQDALATIRLAWQQFGGPLYLWGESLGCGVVAAAVARTEVPVQGVVLFLPWDSLPDLAQTHYWYLPARWLVRDTYNNIDNLMNFQGRVAVVLAGEDEVIPLRHGQRLYAALTAEKKLWVFPGARHNEMPLTATLAWWGEVVDFIASQPP